MLEWQNSTFFPHFFSREINVLMAIFIFHVSMRREGKKLFWAIDSNTTLMASSVCLLYFPQFLACRVKNTQDYFRLLIKERESSFKFSPFFTFLFSKKEVFLWELIWRRTVCALQQSWEIGTKALMWHHQTHCALIKLLCCNFPENRKISAPQSTTQCTHIYMNTHSWL